MACPLPDLDNKVIGVLGESITLRAVTITLDDRGDATESNSDSTVTAIVEPITEGSDMKVEGYVQTGDILVWFKSDATVSGDTDEKKYHVQWNSEWYKIVDCPPVRMDGTTLARKALCRRI